MCVDVSLRPTRGCLLSRPHSCSARSTRARRADGHRTGLRRRYAHRPLAPEPGLERVQLGINDSFSGANASPLFIGIVTVDDATNDPVAAIARAHLINGGGWPGVSAAEGVVLDDVVVGNVSTVPEPSAVALLAMGLLGFCCSSRSPRSTP